MNDNALPVDTESPDARAPYRVRVDFVIELARRLHMYGTTAQRLEGAVTSVARRIDVYCEVWSNPTGMILSFADFQRSNESSVTRVIRLDPGEDHLGRLARADFIAEEVLAGRMGIIGNFYSPLVIVLSYLFLGERLLPLQLAGFVLVSIGVWVAAWPRKLAEDLTPSAPRAPRHTARGFGFALLAVGLMACSIVLVKRVLEAQPLFWVTGLRMAGAIAAMLLIAAWRGELAQLRPQAPGLPWPKLLLAAFIGQFLAMVLWLAGYKFTLASVAAVLNETASIFILLLAAAWLKEPLTRRALGGVVLTFSGVCFMLWAR